MCRFLLVKSQKPIKPLSLLSSFAAMAQKSKAFDGDWQGDGWGIAWLDEKHVWHEYKSLLPVWKDTKAFDTISHTTLFTVHARSASFPQHKNVIEYNQPFTNKKFAFVFNGLLRGVSLPQNIQGSIGSQKIWFLLQDIMEKNTPSESLKKILQLLKNNSREIKALNIGIADTKNIYTLCYYSQFPSYYQIHHADTKDIKIICSEPIDGFSFKIMCANEIISL